MNILLLHNYYKQPGGEDQVLASESSLLKRHGHSVGNYTVHNDQISNLTKSQLATTTVWSYKTYREIRGLIQREQPKILHVHNTFPLISPSVYYAAKREGVPVVQTLHNFRLVCPNGLLFRDNRVCEDCLEKRVSWPAVVHSCFRESRIETTGVVAMLALHRGLGTWVNYVDVYIALSMFAKNKFIKGGIPEQKIFVKSNFVNPDPGLGERQGNYALFVGRLSQEKGLQTLIDAWVELKCNPPLKIIGDGPMADQVASFSKKVLGVEWLGRRPRDEVFDFMKNAMVLIFPSHCYEGLPMTIIEAFAAGLPVIGSNQGSVREIITNEHTGLHFGVGDARDLSEKVRWIVQNPDALASMSRFARQEFERKYTDVKNYQELMAIYQLAIQQSELKCDENLISKQC